MAAGFRKVEGFELLRSSRGDQDGLSSSGIVQVEAFVQSAPSGYINVCVSHHLIRKRRSGGGRREAGGARECVLGGGTWIRPVTP